NRLSSRDAPNPSRGEWTIREGEVHNQVKSRGRPAPGRSARHRPIGFRRRRERNHLGSSHSFPDDSGRRPPTSDQSPIIPKALPVQSAYPSKPADRISSWLLRRIDRNLTRAANPGDTVTPIPAGAGSIKGGPPETPCGAG